MGSDDTANLEPANHLGGLLAVGKRFRWRIYKGCGCRQKANGNWCDTWFDMGDFDHTLIPRL
jgi:hypothetical protein